ncbi:hypothetical protein PPERSA_05478 [Pseudocohnilembus persalinus]|uniref:Uncharacterized protein n=1 Tax=Pseudocohnilembus persalinus TaxID=266149 RepID=A0A0V0R857_PSEPJ|nr:hypothetical protein PPERSA_05478 [Pseudocohnilembus persalinus]|eukprot:KRX10658.1 hypothetical protein PPERSA_05478 [Pseudocohnilembus persalinus]
MADYFNTNPRDFNYQSLHYKYPLEINGKTKKLNPDNKADGSWQHFIERGPEFKIIKGPEYIQNQQIQKQKEGNQTKRCIEPQYNEQEFKYMQKKRVSINNQNNQNQKPGNLLNLLNKEENVPKISKKQFTNIQQQGEAKEIINYQNNYQSNNKEKKKIFERPSFQISNAQYQVNVEPPSQKLIQSSQIQPKNQLSNINSDHIDSDLDENIAQNQNNQQKQQQQQQSSSQNFQNLKSNQENIISNNIVQQNQEANVQNKDKIFGNTSIQVQPKIISQQNIDE